MLEGSAKKWTRSPQEIIRLLDDGWRIARVPSRWRWAGHSGRLHKQELRRWGARVVVYLKGGR